MSHPREGMTSLPRPRAARRQLGNRGDADVARVVVATMVGQAEKAMGMPLESRVRPRKRWNL